MREAKPASRERGARRGAGGSGPGRLTLLEVAGRARHALAEVTGLHSEGVSSIELHDDGTWKAIVELLELARIPATDDVLGTYEATGDATGELLGYRRVRRYPRGRSLQDNGGWR
jgi:Gas vesicle synthesis protein GvpO